jgi:ABC-2 type transport system permease protein
VSGLGIALRAEARKFRSSRAALATSALFVGGLVALSVTFAFAAQAGNVTALAKLGPLADGTPWQVLSGSAVQIAGAGGLFACGIVVAWSFGREFTEGTISGLFALPVGRATIALAKILVYLAWSAGLAIVATAAVVVAGLVAGLGPLDADTGGALARLPVLIACCGLIALPAALLATLGRGLLAGIGAVAVIVVVAQISVFAGAGPWFPLATPALWAIDPASVPAAAWMLVPVLPVAAAALTALAWRRLQLDR